MTRFCTKPMPEYSWNRQRRDYQDALPTPYMDEQLHFDAHCIQDQSRLLFNFPLELRLLIWKYAIGNQTIHIINKYRKLGHTIMDTTYWRQHNAERPSLRACSWMYTYGSLPTTKQLVDNNMCDLLVTCRQIYQEAVTLMYSTNAFAIWDLRTIEVFKRCVPPRSWEAIRSFEMFVTFHRKDDITYAVEARSLLQLEVRSNACTALASLPNLRSLRVFVANPWHLDEKCLTGRRSNICEAILDFVRVCKVKAKVNIYLPARKNQKEGNGEQWNLRSLNEEDAMRLEKQLQRGSMNSELLHSGGDNRSMLTSQSPWSLTAWVPYPIDSE